MNSLTDTEILAVLSDTDPAKNAHPSPALRTKVLAAATKPVRRPGRMQRFSAAAVSLTAGLGAILVSASLVGSASLAGSSPETVAGSFSNSVPVSPVSPAAPDGVDGLSPQSSADSQQYTDKNSQTSSTTEEQPSSTSPDSAAMVKSGSMIVETADVGASRDGFVNTVLASGGYVSSETMVKDAAGQYPAVVAPYSSEPYMGSTAEASSYYYPAGYKTYVVVSAVVDADKLTEVTENARSYGTVVSSSMSASDVSGTLVDIDARIVSLTSSLKTLNKLLSSADQLDDVLVLEEAVSKRNAELESLKAQQRTLNKQVATSTLTVTFADPESKIEPSTLVPAPQDGSGAVGWVFLGVLLVVAVGSGVYAYRINK